MIEELKSVLVADEEISRVREFTEQMRAAEAARDREQSELKGVVAELEEAVRVLRESSTRTAADWRSLNEHTAAMQAMENDKFDLAKNINEQEAALSGLEAEIEHLRQESEAIDDWTVDRDVAMDKDACVGTNKQPCSAAISGYRIRAAWQCARWACTVTPGALDTTHCRIVIRRRRGVARPHVAS